MSFRGKASKLVSLLTLATMPFINSCGPKIDLEPHIKRKEFKIGKIVDIDVKAASGCSGEGRYLFQQTLTEGNYGFFKSGGRTNNDI